jgi:hypothetical protein
MGENSIKVGTAAMFSDNSFDLRSFEGGIHDSIIARVTFILLDDSDQVRFNSYGGWKALGTIECVPYLNDSKTTTKIVAKPMNGHFSKYPVLNELVLIKKAVSYISQGGQNNYNPDYYYTDIIHTWNAIEHNATPDSNLLSSTIENTTTYSDSTIGHTAKNNIQNSVSITGQFNEKGKTRKLISLPGDVTIQGRSGHSIRFGSSIDGFNSPIKGNDRSPLIMISNNQHERDNSNPSFEDINKDGSSLYILNGHDIGFEISSLNFDSHNMVINDSVKSNYIVPTNPSEVPFTQSPTKTDSVVNKDKDSVPSNFPVSNSTPTKNTNNTDDDLEELPANESLLPFVKETEKDIVNINNTYNDFDNNTIPDSKSVVNNISSTKLIFNKVPFEIQQNKTYCLVACISMLLRSLNISNVNQDKIGSLTDKTGNLNLFDVGKVYNLSFKKIPISGGIKGYQTISEKLISNNSPFILERKSIEHPDLDSKSHFVVVVGIDSDGSIITRDPRGKNFSNYKLNVSDLKPSGGTIRIFK